MNQQQTVVITRLADRHGEPHARDYAQSSSVGVRAGPLADCLREAAEQLGDYPEGRYSLSISDPFDSG